MRAPEVAKWQRKYRVDVTLQMVRNGGAQQTVWEILNGNGEDFMAKPIKRIKERWLWFWTWREAFERVSLRFFVGVGDALQLPEEDLAGAVWVLRVPGASAVRRMCGRAAHRPSRLSCQCPSGVVCCLRIVLLDALREVTIFYPPLKLTDLRG